jgi:hypothetical protein
MVAGRRRVRDLAAGVDGGAEDVAEKCPRIVGVLRNWLPTSRTARAAVAERNEEAETT